MDSMDGSHIALLIAIGILIALSAYFSATETAFSALSRAKLKRFAAEGNPRASLALSLSEDYDSLLSTILIGNNIVNITSASLATVLFVAWFEDAGVTLSTVVMTVLVLIFGEISPKSLAKEAPERFAMFSAPVLRVFLFVLTPLNLLFLQWKKLLSRVFRVHGDRGVTEEELLTVVEEAEQDGGIDADEGELIRSALAWGDLCARDVLTPRVDLVAIANDAPADAIAAAFREHGFSRLPVYHETVDNIVGVLHEKDFHYRVQDGGEPLSHALQSPLFVAPSMQLDALLALLQRSHAHLAVVSDEYGGTMGVVTLEDVLEALVGEIWDEHDNAVAELTPLGGHAYSVRGATRLDKLFDRFSLGDAPEDCASVGGWAVCQLGRIPCEGDTFTYGGLAVTVTRIDRRRVMEVRVEKETVLHEA